ncbi:MULTISPECIES: hypothetical protein [Flavobacteriaceae]|uniref:hypothetical protein n=1 Tax=Flavobacteriaceae TaxID=49546 RepID=UPI0023494C6B|nr:hypothetical protein [Muricauda sp. SP22]MDC6362727.1 hypothetical protein [Muricauda sp. SP22]
MKKIKAITLTFTLFATMALFANPSTEENPEKSLCSQIQGMLKNNTLKLATEDWTAQVIFTINKNGELVVLSVDTKNSTLEGFIKSRLNYQKVKLEGIPSGKVFAVPVRVTA